MDTNVIILDGKQIQEVTSEGFWYVTESDSREYIDFAACYANYVRKVTSPEYIERAKELNPQSRWDDEGIKEYIARRIAWKEIGRGQGLGPPWDDDGPYLQFHTEPPVRFKYEKGE